MADVPAWFPDWARELADLFFAKSTCLYVLNGNVNDLVYWPAAGNSDGQFVDVADFLAGQVFGPWDLVLSYDLGRGLQVVAAGNAKRHQSMMQTATALFGTPNNWPRDPEQILDLVDRIVQRNLVEDDPNKRKRIAFLFPYAQYLVPSGDHAALARGPASRLVRFLGWAQNPYIKRTNMAFVLIADAVSEINARLVQSPHVASVEVTLPDEAVRRAFAQRHLDRVSAGMQANGATPVSGAETPPEDPSVAPAELIARMANGLNLINLNVALSRAGGSDYAWDVQRFRQLKKTLIERQCSDLVSFVEPAHRLDIVVGHTAAKARLQQDADWIAQGLLQMAPMGYLICGPVGTGKTFLAECYAGSIGIPCLELRNFRSKYVGETEGNLERVLTVLRSLGPVVVIIDEADAALGNREQSGDSGTSNRVFSMIATQMGNTRFRGKIIWMLLTSRPELLPIDLKRQGRAEVHIPLFYPQAEDEIATMFLAMAKKNRIALAPGAVPAVTPERNLSGADIESIILGANREMMAAGRSQLERADLDTALATFIPSAQGLVKELQEINAVLECTDRRFLTKKWRDLLDQPEGRAALQQQAVQLQRLIER